MSVEPCLDRNGPAGEDTMEPMKFQGLGVFGSLAERAVTMKATGCVLAWVVFNQSFGKDLAWLLGACEEELNLKAVHQGARERVPLTPFSLDRLSSLKATLKSKKIEEVCTEEFIGSFFSDCWLLLAIICLNLLSGGSRELKGGRWTTLQRRAVGNIEASVNRMLAMDAEVRRSAEEKELADRFLSYSGEEVPKMLKLSFEQAEAALPPLSHGGSIDVCRLVSDRTASFLQAADLCVLEDVGQDLPPLQAKVHFEPGEQMKVAKLLVERNICSWIRLDEVLTYRNQKVLNGLFAVGKDSRTPGGKVVQRTIMNLIPSNAVLMKLEGTVQKLPNVCQWLSTTLEEGEELEFYQSDMSSAFYLFRLPESWRRCLAFNVVVDAAELGKEGNERWALCCNVLPMGWSSAVGVMQEVADSLTKLGGLPASMKLERDKVVPAWMTRAVSEAQETGKSWFHVYLDNFCAAEKIVRGSSSGEARNLHNGIEDSWREWGVLSSAKKRIVGSKEVLELGAFAGGKGKILGASMDRLVKLIQVTLVVISQNRLNYKCVQMVAGRWVYVLQFRRAGMSMLEVIWQFIAKRAKGRNVEMEVRKELLACCFGACLLHTHLGAKISQVTTASDASSTGGAVGVARQLEEAGQGFVQSELCEENLPKEVSVLVLSLFNGVGGAFRCYDVAGVCPQVLISYDTHKPANRIVSRRWPQAIIERDVRECTEEKLRSWLYAFPEVEAIHIWAGFPCVDLSSAKAYRQNLDGAGSGLFYEVLRILRSVKKVFGVGFDIRFIVENVASMDKEAAEEISAHLGRKPVFVNCVDAVPIQRPRFCWTSVDLEVDIEGTHKVISEQYMQIRMPADYPADSQWLEEGCSRTAGVCYPTCMKAIKRMKPPPKPAGLSRCDLDAQDRWRVSYAPLSLLGTFHHLGG